MRSPLRSVLVAAAALIVGCGFVSLAPAASPPPRPDILLVMPDQMRGDCLSAVGHPVLHTPTLDQLASEGVLFRRAYSPVPSCIPARYAMLTGQSPQYSGIVGFKARPISVVTLPTALDHAGYTTLLVGRNMHQVPASGNLGFDERILGTVYVPHDDYDDFLRHADPQSGGIAHLLRTHDLSFNGWHAHPWPFADDLQPVEWTIREARRTLAAQPAGKPLFLVVSFFAPHPPLCPLKPYFDRFMAMKNLPQPAMGGWVDRSDLSTKGNRVGDRLLLTGDQLRQTEAGYFGLIEEIDHDIAPVIAQFKARSEAAGRPWLVIFTSDHGEMLGDHGYFRKCEPYEGSANIPFIIAGSPSLGFRAGGRSMSPVSLEDLMPTLLPLTGARTPDPIDGVNLLPALRNPSTRVRDVLHFEHAPCYSKAQAFQALTDGRFKYIWRTQPGREQLFDLQSDPHELHDLATDPAAAAELLTWRTRLIALLAPRPEGFVKNNQLISARPYPPINPGVPRGPRPD